MYVRACVRASRPCPPGPDPVRQDAVDSGPEEGATVIVRVRVILVVVITMIILMVIMIIVIIVIIIMIIIIIMVIVIIIIVMIVVVIIMIIITILLLLLLLIIIIRRRRAGQPPEKAPAGFRKGRCYVRKPPSSSHFSVRAFRAYPLIEIRQAAPCRAIRGNRISVNSTLPRLLTFQLRRGSRKRVLPV